MDIFIEMLALVVLFALRLGVPIAVTAAVVWGLRRLDVRWQAEAEAQHTSRAVAAGLVSAHAAASPLVIEHPCWELNNCPPEKRQLCPACTLTDIPCWMARLRADGRLPGRCYGCALFRTRLAVRSALA
ncbi:MAG TPA: hypothetical protein DCL15_08060 [Chloroflexi bacterium]|nr:hypothetical protein [Chloroflexota bacterium]HHW85176.1 hypothetical protein [Chloroflexota bacterium]